MSPEPRMGVFDESILFKIKFEVTMGFYSLILQIFKGRFLKTRFYSYLGRFISTSVAPTYTNFSSFIHNYILQIFTEGIVDLSFIALFIYHFMPKNMTKIVFLGMLTVLLDSWSDKKRYPKSPL